MDTAPQGVHLRNYSDEKKESDPGFERRLLSYFEGPKYWEVQYFNISTGRQRRVSLNAGTTETPDWHFYRLTDGQRRSTLEMNRAISHWR